MTRILTSAARLQLQTMIRDHAIWMALVGVSWIALVLVQEPDFAVRLGLPLVEPSIRFGAVGLGCLLGPLAAESGQRSWSSTWNKSRQPSVTLLGIWLGAATFAILLAAGYSLIYAGAHAALTSRAEPFSVAPWAGVRLLLAGALSLALAPAVATSASSLVGRALLWTVLLTTSSGFLGFSAPIPIPLVWSLATEGAEASSTVLASLLALAASFCLAIAMQGRQTAASR